MTGIYAFLAWCPLWALALILYAMTDCAIHVLRDWREGLGYQVAYSAKIGDAGLIVVVLIAATILKRGNLTLPGWLMNETTQFWILFTGMVIGLAVSAATMKSRSGQLADRYHDMVIAPFILFFAITLVPVIYLGGTMTEKISTACLILLWVVLVIYDIKTERMNQRRWLEMHGVIILQ